jgi:16S rRNA (cytidine1402-2'-O)-methyltransferase
VLLYESARRIADTTDALANTLGDRRVLIAREMTKRFEEVFRGSLEQARAWLTAAAPRGEYTLVVYPPDSSGMGLTPVSHSSEDPPDLDATLSDALESGLSPTAAAREAARITGRPRREVYAAMLRSAVRDRVAHDGE